MKNTYLLMLAVSGTIFHWEQLFTFMKSVKLGHVLLMNTAGTCGDGVGEAL